MSTTYSRLFETLANFPDPVLAEVLDFAEFLQAKRLGIHLSAHDESAANHANPAPPANRLESATSFAEDAPAAQAPSRTAWN